ncbi:inositol phosphorylceramide synthase 3 [Blastocystis sp. subtype 4]|uniref:inositol phosphorylceramide synthase 3 n=1 Tax=Blastocystis sp. subtype 4 TaxID=944170 RepID=UPI00071162E1|nr:inositol phosphorylceramide synthase 3 [Blastocystis sp. subtype 4]KNB46189.1 inositol phosphorylceramide synthase 3 [Blastocystis sp. subtype 4]|eukprot:XP_014529632.1 inositol phosphorylceramide synthase 3 [Blastocystis sp. subtype 4]
MLKDIGFMLIPEFHNQLLASDVLSFIPFIILCYLALRMDGNHIGKFLSDNLRIFSIYYLVRAFCEPVTLLPGPAVHCRPGSTFNPPKDWVDIVAHMPVDGLSFSSCGDLIPSGHIGFTVMGLIAIMRALPKRWTPYRRGLSVVCILYVFVTIFFILAYRKHYTVDLIVVLFYIAMDGL